MLSICHVSSGETSKRYTGCVRNIMKNWIFFGKSNATAKNPSGIAFEPWPSLCHTNVCIASTCMCCVWTRFVPNEIVRLIAIEIALFIRIYWNQRNSIQVGWFYCCTSIVSIVSINAAGTERERGQIHKFIWQIYMIAVWHVFASTSVEFDGYCALFRSNSSSSSSHSNNANERTVLQRKIKTKRKKISGTICFA